MCGRYTQTRSWSELVELYGITETPAADRRPEPRYNVAPTQDVPVVRPAGDAGGRALVMLRWGLVPFWAKDSAIGSRMINARAESVAGKPAFRHAFRKRRCLVVADGFYEWQKRPQGGKQPFYITSPDTIAFAGLWDSWRDETGAVLETCTIITTRANDQLRPLHDRMPVILAPEDFAPWLDPAAPPELAEALLAPYAGELHVSPVDRRVNSVRNDDPSCVAPVAVA